MNMNFFNPKKSLRTFQSGGSMPKREQFNSEEEFQSAMETYLNSIGTPSVASSFVGPIDERPKTTAIPSVVTPQVQQAIPGYEGASIVDFLKSMGVDSSKANRKKLAALSGDTNYDMSGSDNQALMEYVRKNAQGKDKIKNSNGDIVSLDGAGQVPLIKIGSVPGKKLRTVGNSDDVMYAADATKRLAMYNTKPISNVTPSSSVSEGINFLNRKLSFGDASPYDNILNYDRSDTNKSAKGTTASIDFNALRDIRKAIKNKSGKVITSDGRQMDYNRLTPSDREDLLRELQTYNRSYTF